MFKRGGFDSYELEKSVESTMSDYEVTYSTENVTDTTYVDSDVDPLSYQYYRVTVIDTFSYETKNNSRDRQQPRYTIQTRCCFKVKETQL